MFTSNAEWTKIAHTTDTHPTKEAALAVCKILIDDYGAPPGCGLRGQCTAAWVEEIEQPEQPVTDGQKLVAFCDRMMECSDTNPAKLAPN